LLILYYKITFTQVQAGFETQVHENVLYCDMDAVTYKIIDKLKREDSTNGGIRKFAISGFESKKNDNDLDF